MAENSATSQAAWRAYRRRELRLETIHHAVIRGDLGRVRQLLSADPKVTEARAGDGSTPLMLAALFQRKRAVQLLMKHKANTAAKDSKGKTAMQHCLMNSYTANKWRLYSEVSGCRIRGCKKSDYKWIVAALKYQNRHQHLPQPIIHISYKSHEIRFFASVGEGKRGCLVQSSSRRHGLPDHLLEFNYTSADGRSRHFKCIQEFIQPAGVDFQKRLTVGFLAVGKQLQLLKMAISGWSEQTEDLRILDGAVSTRLVKAFGAAAGLALHKHQYDKPGGNDMGDGYWCSSHVEKRLALYHVVQVAREHLGRDLDLELQSGDMGWLRELREANLTHEDRDATILLGNVPCNNCHSFIEELNDLTGMQIHVLPIRPLAEDEPAPRKRDEDEDERLRIKQPENDEKATSSGEEEAEPQNTRTTTECTRRAAKGSNPNKPTFGNLFKAVTKEEFSELQKRSHPGVSSRNAGIRRYSQARAEARSGRGVSRMGRANSGREIRGSRYPGGRRGRGRGQGPRSAIGRGLVDNGVAQSSRTSLSNLEQFRYQAPGTA
ncbi:hypothetical protein GGTG_01177 [Gaeumannomyces tritici R3-111a-1]|uniref:Single-strand DNA deaminase toxin A-like C-terminal domain-containing protein n=1 Tax=Gaeumannomyces tritici (strain R3-111a-1) TaxID=644352 RepID=J3NIU3_GAET3|nr:hypothetical protein GGTG_01177 [Gaeumannomyces tritici R3-111a-1]EJT81193.1 hypothetical protein GGTG_01177 [Gaeumannomyces tritici R3-111a-1]